MNSTHSPGWTPDLCHPPSRDPAAPRRGGGGQLGFAAYPGPLEVPQPAHAPAIDEHHRGIHVRNGQVAGSANVQVEQTRRGRQIDLTDVVVDRPSGKARELANREAIERETRPPASPIESRQVPHQIDPVLAPRIDKDVAADLNAEEKKGLKKAIQIELEARRQQS